MMNSGIRNFLNKLRMCDRNQQQLFIDEIIASIQMLSTTDLQFILEFLTIINDFDLEIKLFSLLSVCIASNDVYYEIIISHTPIYEKLENILSRGLCLKSTVVINFITAMLSKDADAEARSCGKQLATRAQNMIRVSGSLRWITSFFMHSMVFLDTWKALCQCLAECCRDSPMNKDHCSHLVPLCVNKCLQGMTEVLVVLQSLLYDHPKNLQNFLKYNGIEVFKKENLQLTACLQLLTSLAQNPEISAKLRDTAVPRNIAEILYWSGPNTQKGQWCTIILFYLKLDKEEFNQHLFNKSLNSVSEVQDRMPTKHIIQHIPNAESVQKSQINAPKTIKSSHNEDEQKSAHNIEMKDNDDTANLLRNVMQEVLYWKTNEKSDLLTSPHQTVRTQESDFNHFRVNDTYSPPKMGHTFNIFENKTQYRNTMNELSFTFLGNTTLKRKPEVPNRTQNSIATTTQICNHTTKALHVTSINKTFDIGNFNPPKTSTPKKVRADASLNKNTESQIKFTKRASSCFHTKSTLRRKKMQRAKRELPVKKMADRSMSSKIFEAVNETCTTIVKTVKDIFMPWKNNTTNETNSTRKPNTMSFMKYMRKRDAILRCTDRNPGNEFHFTNDNADTKDMNILCSTCNDTKMLKLKLTSDEQLKKTLKKLKLGLNLYGCDFKRISKTLWPQETYMTPTVLYNLYRKLILK